MFFGGDPFEHFAGQGGGGSRRSGMGGMGGPRPDVDTTKLYETLGVSFVIARLSSFCNLCWWLWPRFGVTTPYEMPCLDEKRHIANASHRREESYHGHGGT